MLLDSLHLKICRAVHHGKVDKKDASSTIVNLAVSPLPLPRLLRGHLLDTRLVVRYGRDKRVAVFALRGRRCCPGCSRYLTDDGEADAPGVATSWKNQNFSWSMHRTSQKAPQQLQGWPFL
ncbi:uncharacterized protein LOC103315330 [Nasonia vitripennis]|uniref:Uncharacterized protein n=1 Tax=Nasonia vitripennis TaxID=7425 RepID=A0A7M7QK28_NASVI|nr:uncharacterized protein LOC103315330 [Nasonia vitripennis]